MWLKNTPVAHRGLHTENYPENSLPAFARAIEKGYAIETDIQRLRDGGLAVFHDHSLSRMCGADKNLFELDTEALSEFSLGASGEKIPLFQEFLEFVGGRVPLLIELKLYGDTKIPELCEEVAKELDGYKGEFAIQAFHPYIVQWFCDNRAEFLRGQLSCYFEGEKLPLYQKILLKRLFFNRKTKPHFVSYDVHHINSRIVRRARKKCTVLAWTVRKENNLAEIKKYCDNIIFEGFEV